MTAAGGNIQQHNGFTLANWCESGPSSIKSVEWSISAGDDVLFWFDAEKKQLYINHAKAKSHGICLIYADRPWKEICAEQEARKNV